MFVACGRKKTRRGIWRFAAKNRLASHQRRLPSYFSSRPSFFRSLVPRPACLVCVSPSLQNAKRMPNVLIVLLTGARLIIFHRSAPTTRSLPPRNHRLHARVTALGTAVISNTVPRTRACKIISWLIIGESSVCPGRCITYVCYGQYDLRLKQNINFNLPIWFGIEVLANVPLSLFQNGSHFLVGNKPQLHFKRVALHRRAARSIEVW